MATANQGMDTPDDLNGTDRGVLRLLAEGRETRGSLSRQLDKHENYVSTRLKWLRATGLIRYHHEGTSLHEITDKGREWLTEVNDGAH